MATNLFPAPHLSLFCLTSLPGSPCPLHFSISVVQSRNYRLLELHTPASLYGLFCVSLHSLKLLQVLSELNMSHSTILVHVDSQGTKFPRCHTVWLVSLLQVILSIRWSVMCRLWRQNCHPWDSCDIRDHPGFHLIQVISDFHTLPSPEMEFVPFYSSICLTNVFPAWMLKTNDTDKYFWQLHDVWNQFWNWRYPKGHLSTQLEGSQSICYTLHRSYAFLYFTAQL